MRCSTVFLGAFPSPALRASVVLLFLSVSTVDAQRESPTFRLTTNDLKTYSGSLRKWSSDEGARISSETPVEVPLGRIVELRQENANLPVQPEENILIFGNGDCLALDDKASLNLANRKLSFKPHQSVNAKKSAMDVSVNYVALIWRSSPEGFSSVFKTIRHLLNEKRDTDVIYLQNGDRVECNIVRLDKKIGCEIRIGDTSTTLPFARVAVVAFNNRFLARMRRRQPYPFVVSRDGSRVSFFHFDLNADKRQFEGRTLYGSEMAVPMENVVAIQMRNGPAVYLSDLSPKRYEYFAFSGVKWPLMNDANVHGRQLRIGNNAYPKGLGMHSRSSVTYALNGDYCWLHAYVGLDHCQGKKGRVRIQIDVDGSKHFTHGGRSLRWTDGPIEVKLDVRKAHTLTLIVDYDGFGDVQGTLNWGNARLLR